MDKSHKKEKRRDKSDLGPNFVAPDGRWGWFVVVAAGCSNLCTFPVLQQFGLIYRERMATLGITSSQITTIINLNQAFTSCVGLANGPMFRRFTFRQVSFFGALLVAVGLFCTSFANSFSAFVITFSVLYGAGVGIAASANSLALNTYFKEKRRIATGISWTATALGPILIPHIVTVLLELYGVQGTVLLFSGFALNAVACSLIFQPVRWHTKNLSDAEELLKDNEYECFYCQTLKRGNPSIFSSQYIYNADCNAFPGYEIIDPGTPMMALANDGWSSRKRSLYGSKHSLNSRTPRIDYESRRASTRTSNQNLVMSNRPSYVNLVLLEKEEMRRLEKEQRRREKRREKKDVIKIEENVLEDCPSLKAPHDLIPIDKVRFVNKIEEHSEEDCPTQKAPHDLPETDKNHLPKKDEDNKYITDNHSVLSVKKNDDYRQRTNTFNVEKEVLRVASKKLEEYVDNGLKPVDPSRSYCTCEEEKKLIQIMNEEDENCVEEEDEKLSFWQKVVIFFDLGLLKDWTYINIMIGVTISNFSELNFSILTPFVLADFGFTKMQIAAAMSFLGGMDIGVRFFIPFIAGKIGWENRTFFLFGVMGMALGRIFLAHFQSYYVGMALAGWIGLNKGLRTVFMALCIPSHVPLNRLPAATGLHLLFAGLFYITFGPVVGWIRDATDYTVTLHCLNITTYLTAISWGLEKLYRVRQEKKKLLNENLQGDYKN